MGAKLPDALLEATLAKSCHDRATWDGEREAALLGDALVGYLDDNVANVGRVVAVKDTHVLDDTCR